MVCGGRLVEGRDLRKSRINYVVKSKVRRNSDRLLHGIEEVIYFLKISCSK